MRVFYLDLVFGFFTLLYPFYPFAPYFLVGFYVALACNVLFYYILNRFIYPKVIYSNYFFKEYFLGILVVVIAFVIIGSFMLPFNENVCTFCDDYEELKHMSSIERFYTYFGQFNQAFIGLLFLKMMIFYISWRIQGFIFKEQYKAYRIKDFVISKPTNKGKYIGLCIGIFFTLTYLDISIFMLIVGEPFKLMIPIYELIEFIYKYFHVEEYYAIIYD